jgi:hypothetical protein
MDEASARALLEQMSVAKPPPSRVDIGLARRRGGRRLRRRRWGLAAAPVLAAAAVAAVVLGTGAFPGAVGPGKGNPAQSGQLRPPDRFNPLAPYAAFGWLPRGVPRAADGAISLPSQLLLLTGSARTGDIWLRVWAPGTCNRDAAQIISALHQHLHARLNCSQHGFADFNDYAASQAPAVNGRPAFWLIDDTLAWEYAPDSWATLTAYLGHGLSHAAAMVKIAAHVRFAAARTSLLKFPFQLTGLPASWQAVSAVWRPTSSGLLGGNLSVGPASRSPGMGVISHIAVTPGHGGSCWSPPGSAQRVTLGGVTAFLTLRGAHNGVPASQELCVPKADGLSVDFTLYRLTGSPAFPFGGAPGIFLHHLHLLGPDPANWTTRPLG